MSLGGVTSTLASGLPGDSEFAYTISVRVPSGAVVTMEAYASQLAHEFQRHVAARYGRELEAARLAHGGRGVDGRASLAAQRISPGSLLVVSPAPPRGFARLPPCEPAGPDLAVFVRLPSGRIPGADVCGGDAAGSVAPWLEQKCAEQLPDVRLSANGLNLNPAKTFKDAGIRGGTVIHVSHRTRGGSSAGVPVEVLRAMLAAVKAKRLAVAPGLPPTAAAVPPASEPADWVPCCAPEATDTEMSEHTAGDEDVPPPFATNNGPRWAHGASWSGGPSGAAPSHAGNERTNWTPARRPGCAGCALNTLVARVLR